MNDALDLPSGLAAESEHEQWLKAAESGQITWSELAERFLQMEYAAGSEHRPDLDRKRRCGFGEVIFGEGKSADAIAHISRRLLDGGSVREVLVTRVDCEQMRQVVPRFAYARYDSLGRTLRLSDSAIPETQHSSPALPHNDLAASRTGDRATELVVVVTAGSTDLPVAREALETLRWMGASAHLITDVGVAGPFRLLPHLKLMRSACALVVIAGMEGALASVAGGLVPCPVIAVPTSVGYGSNFAGVTTLLSMLSSCAAGVTVVNIDGGFKGGYVAGLIAARNAEQS